MDRPHEVKPENGFPTPLQPKATDPAPERLGTWQRRSRGPTHLSETTADSWPTPE